MNAKQVAIYALVLIFAIAIAIGGWYLERTAHYSWSYESKVEDTVKTMVKPECLKSP
jgi:TRAP-type C4-dicarboxylate transport system permease small subunit